MKDGIEQIAPRPLTPLVVVESSRISSWGK